MNHPRKLSEFMELYPTEECCRRATFEHLWPVGFVCSRCARTPGSCAAADSISARRHYQGMPTAGTVLARTRTDLRKRFMAIWLLASTKKAPSAAELTRRPGVTDKIAWLMRRKITHAMTRREGEVTLRGIVELDEGLLGGKRRGPRSHGRRQPHKTMVAVAAEQTPAGGLGRAHLGIVADSLSAAALAATAAGGQVQSGGCSGCPGLASAGYGHRPRSLPGGAEIDAWLPWSHIVLSDSKRWTLDAFYGISAAHLQACLDEFCCRLDRHNQRHYVFRRIFSRWRLCTQLGTCALPGGT